MLKALDKFFDYKPVLSIEELERTDFKNLLETAKTYLSEDEVAKVKQAYEFAKQAHGDDKRLSGEPYLVHPVKVANFLMVLKPDIETIITALLHDVIEDTPYTYEDIQVRFWKKVADMCSGLEKVSKVRYKDLPKDKAGEARHLETLKKTFLAMGRDLRVIFIKLADRVHNIQTLHFHPKEEKRKRIALETMKIYVPIAQRLWLSYFQTLLENGSFKILNPQEFDRIYSFLKKKFPQSDVIIKRGIQKLTQLFEKEWFKEFEIKWRIKSPYRVWKKMQKYKTDNPAKILDIIAFRIILPDVASCYAALGIIHQYYIPLLNKIKDYISLPKPNGYRSLHTTVLGFFSYPVEFQIRTFEMDQIAEYGVAAHFAYKEAGKSVSVSQQQAHWIQKLQEIVKKYQWYDDKQSFEDELQVEVLGKNIFVYTPKGDVVELPQGSWVLDFAFRIHTDIWLKVKSAIVNWKIVPLDYKLKTWDIVEIKTYKNRYSASKGWLNYIVTPSARAKLQRFLKQKDKELYIQKGKELLNARLEELGLPLLGSAEDKISKQLSKDELENNLILIAQGQLPMLRFLKKFWLREIEALEKQKLAKQQVKDEIQKDLASVKREVIIDFDKSKLNYSFCQACNPKVWDRIIAKTGRTAIKVHKISCKSLKSINYAHLLEAHWENQQPQPYKISFRIWVLNRPGALLQLLSVLEEFRINILDLKLGDKKMIDGQEYVATELVLSLTQPAKIGYLIKELKNQRRLVICDKLDLVE